MANNRTPRSSTRSSPRSSPRSAKATPKATKASGLRKSSTAASKKRPTAKTPAKKPVGRAKEVKHSHSPTGMTETTSPSSSDRGDSEDAFDPPSSDQAEDEPVESESELDSDFLDEDGEDDEKAKGKKRKSIGRGGGSTKKVKSSSGKVKVDGYEDEDEDEDDEEEVELEEGQEIAGRIYPAPKTGQVPPGQVSRNTFNFLKNMQIPSRNDRDWFRSHEPAFRQAEKEWQAFVGKVQAKFHERDPDVPILPAKDLIHRIYRDVRFSSDKTPYKKSFSLSTSRGGRKGVWAAYHLSISPNEKSILACGVWQPGKNELATIRHHLLTEPQRFRDVIGAEAFVGLFGPAKPHAKGKRQNVFGNEDALKVAPKGVDKGHRDIDLLKLRSVAVVHHFSDEEVLAEDFQDKVGEIVAVMAPFTHMLNDFISLPPSGDDNEVLGENP